MSATDDGLLLDLYERDGQTDRHRQTDKRGRARGRETEEGGDERQRDKNRDRDRQTDRRGRARGREIEEEGGEREEEEEEREREMLGIGKITGCASRKILAERRKEFES